MVSAAAAPVPPWTVPSWGEQAGLRHGFFGRAGGCSGGDFAALNLSYAVGDCEVDVRRNRELVAAQLRPLRLVLATQVHGDRVCVVTPATEAVGEADVLIAAEPGVAVGVLTADCVPLLLMAPRQRLAAAVHAGWKGTALRIAAGALEHMQRDFGVAPAGIYAAVGPAIGGCCYEVGEEVVARLRDTVGELANGAIERSKGRPHIDLRRLNAAILAAAGVPPAHIAAIGPCTRCAADACFSHRGGGGRSGRQLSFVGWTAA